MSASCLTLALGLALAAEPLDKPGFSKKPGLSAPDAASVQDVIFFADSRPVLIRLHIAMDGKPLDAFWRDFLREFFKSLDADGNGGLNQDEAKQVLLPTTLFAGGNVPLPGAEGRTVKFSVLDVAPKDSKVSSKEFLDFYHQYGGGPLQIQRRISLTPSMATLDATLIKLLQADKKLARSKADFADLAAAVHQLDLDEDEILSLQELGSKPYLTPSPYTVENVEQTTRRTPIEELRFAVVDPGEYSATRLRRQFLAHYGPPGVKLNTKALSRDQTRLESAFFDVLDENKDGKLHSGEFDKFLERPPGLEFTVRLAGASPVRIEIELKKVAETSLSIGEMRKNADGGVSFQMGATRLELAGNSSTGVPAGRQSGQDVYKQMFASADADKNGYLEMKEAQNAPALRNSFKAMDADRDGKLFLTEVSAYVDKFAQMQTKALSSRLTLEVAESQGILEMLDANADGQLTLRELQQSPKVVGGLDRNGNGKLDEEELPKGFRLALGTSNSNVAEPMRNLGQRTRPKAPPSKGPVWFRKMDRNADGDVSAREFLGSKQEFDRLDADGDGLIAADEAEKADVAMRKK